MENGRVVAVGGKNVCKGVAERSSCVLRRLSMTYFFLLIPCEYTQTRETTATEVSDARDGRHRVDERDFPVPPLPTWRLDDDSFQDDKDLAADKNLLDHASTRL